MTLEDEQMLGRQKAVPKYAPFNVSADLIFRAKTGEEEAFTELDLAIRPRLLGYFYNRVPNQAEDLAQDTIIKVYSSLDRFRGDSKRPVPYQFTSWCFAIARSTLYAGLRELPKREKDFVPQNREGDNRSFDEIISDLYYHHNHEAVSTNPPSEKGSDKKTEQTDFNQILGAWFDRNLTERQRFIIVQKTTGKRNAEIGHELQLSDTSIDKEVRRVRLRLERELLDPANFKPLIEFRNENVEGLEKGPLTQAAIKGRLKVIRVLGRVYTSLECIGEYLANRRDSLDKTQALNGLVYIGSHTNYNEYFSLLRYPLYRKFLVFVDNRAYIRPEDLKEIKDRRNQKPIKPSKVLPSVDGYVRLIDIARTHTEYARYRSAIKAGRLDAIKQDGSFLVAPAALSEYDKKYKH